MAFSLPLLDQCACGGMLEDQLIRKRTHFQRCHPFHDLRITCPGNHKHLNFRGKGRCASAAQYPRDECKKIMLEGITSPNTSEGGRTPPSPDMYKKTFSEKLHILRSIAIAKGLKQQWDLIVVPWLEEANINIVKAIYTSVPSGDILTAEPSADVPSGDHSPVEVPQSSGLNTHTQEGVPQVLSSEAVWSLLAPIPDEDSPITHPSPLRTKP